VFCFDQQHLPKNLEDVIENAQRLHIWEGEKVNVEIGSDTVQMDP